MFLISKARKYGNWWISTVRCCTEVTFPNTDKPYVQNPQQNGQCLNRVFLNVKNLCETILWEISFEY